MRRRTASFTMLVLLIGLVAAGEATAGWGPEHVVRDAPEVGYLNATANSAGDRLLTMQGSYVVDDETFGALRPHGAPSAIFGAPFLLAPGRTLNDMYYVPTVEATLAGDGSVRSAALDSNVGGYYPTHTLVLHTFAPDGTPLPDVPVATEPDIYNIPPVVAVGADGTTVVAWSVHLDDDEFQPRVHWAVRPPGGVFGPVQSTTRPSGDVRLAADDAGNIIMAYGESFTEPNAEVPDVRARVMLRPAGGAGFGPAQTISSPGAFSVAIAAVDAVAGRVAVLWSEAHRPAGQTHGQFSEVRAAIGTASGGLRAPTALDRRDDPEDVAPANIALNRAGEAVATWRQVNVGQPSPDAPRAHALAARMNAAGVWEAKTTLPGLLGEFGRPDADIGPDGTAIVTYATSYESFIMVARPGAPFGTPWRIDPDWGEVADVAYGGDGTALLAWLRNGHVHWRSFGPGAENEPPDAAPLPEEAPHGGHDPDIDPPVASILLPPGPVADDATTPTPPGGDVPAGGAPTGQPEAMPAPTAAAPRPLAAAGRRAPTLRCRVPHLAGLTLARARAKLARAHCRLGAVHAPRRHAKHRSTLVVRRQSRPAGRVTTAGARVAVTLGPRRAGGR